MAVYKPSGKCPLSSHDDSNEDFGPSVYLRHAFNNSDHDFQRQTSLRCCHEALKSLPNGLSILDYGTGPSLHETVLTAAKASEIILSDYSEANRKALRQWLEKHPEAFDWSPHFSYAVRELEGGEEEYVEERQEMIRQVVKAVVHCDLTQDPPIESGYDRQYDVVNSCFCVCSASRTHQEYREGITKLAKLVKPGGVLMIYESEHRTCQLASYYLNNRPFPYVAVTSDFALKAFRDAGFSDVTIRIFELDPQHPSRIQRPERIGYFHVRGIK